MTEEQKTRKREYNKQWRSANADKVREYEKRKREKHGDRIAGYQKKYREAKAEEIRAQQRERWANMSAEEKAEYYARRDAAGWARLSKKRYYQKNKATINAKTKAWREKNIERVKSFRREKNLAQYGLTIESRNAMLAAQGGGCAICHCKTPGGRGYWHTDHDHAIGLTAVRGILCSRCNKTLGLLGDTLDAVRTWAAAAVSYMEKSHAVA